MRRPWALPLVPLYGAGAALRVLGWSSGLTPVRKLGWPVVSIGNLSVGGTGKTPFTIALVGLLKERGVHVDVLSRGYGRLSKSVERVDPDGSPERFGDEPLLIGHSAQVPVYVGASRWQAGRLAERESEGRKGVHLLDDGFQHRALARQVDIVLVNSEDLADSLLPAGNLREGLSALRRAQVLAVPATEDEAIRTIEERGLGAPGGQQVWRFRRKMMLPPIPDPMAGRPVVAFCGIARPQQFFDGLTAGGLKLAATRAFPDHVVYSRADLEGLRRLVRGTEARAVMTTAKDLCRLGEHAQGFDWGVPLLAADLRVTLEDEAVAMAWLLHELSAA